MTEALDLPFATIYARGWFENRTFPASAAPAIDALADRKRAAGLRIAAVLPTDDDAETIAPICRTIAWELVQSTGLVDRLLVVDASDGPETGRVAAGCGARVIDARGVMPEIPPAPGRGDTLWRSLACVGDADIVVWLDPDLRGFSASVVASLLAPLIDDDTIHFVNGYSKRPLASGGGMDELLARPLLTTLFPELAGFLQPLSGECAARVDALKRVPFLTGPSVQAALLVDLLGTIGLGGMAQADMMTTLHRTRPMDELSRAALLITRSILRRAEEQGRLKAMVDFPVHPMLVHGNGRSEDAADHALDPLGVIEIERPPHEVIPPYLEALRGGALETVAAR